MIDESYVWQSLQDASRGRHDTGIGTDGAGRWRCDGGRLTASAQQMLDTLGPVAFGGPVFVIGQLGQSLDGRIATASGHSHYVTGQASRIHLHRLRALVDAVLVGAGTVAADDPQLTVRHASGRHPVRVVLDPNARLGADRKVFTDGDAPTLHLTCTGAAHDAAEHVQHLSMDVGDGGLAPQQILAALAERGLSRVLVEGGGLTVSRFLGAAVLDRLHVVVAPMLIGSGRPAVTLPEIATLDDAMRPPSRSQPMGEDMFFDLALR